MLIRPANTIDLQKFLHEKEQLLREWFRVEINTNPRTFTCLDCRKELEIAFPFIPYSIPVTRYDRNGRVLRASSKFFKDAKAAMKHFQDEHWESCIKHKK